MESDPHHQGSSVQLSVCLSVSLSLSLSPPICIVASCNRNMSCSGLAALPFALACLGTGRQSTACHRGSPDSIPGQYVWFVVDEVAVDQAFAWILHAFRFSVSFHQYSIPIKQHVLCFNHLIRDSCNMTALYRVFLSMPRHNYVLSVPHTTTAMAVSRGAPI